MKQKIFEEDSFSLKSELLKKLLEKDVNLKDLIEVEIPNKFKIEEVKIKDKKIYGKEIRNFLDNFEEKNEIFRSSKVYTPIYEAILNAYQHGNNYDNNKKILLSYNLTKKNLEFIISDEGIQSKLHSSFIRYILTLREKKYKKKQECINWYDFSKSKKEEQNLGVGIYFMHVYMDKVLFYRSKELGGTSIYLRKMLK